MPPATLTPRKAPQQARARATHDAMIEAAAQLIRAHGLAGFNTNAVAMRAGVSIGSLYQYFPNKDALMAALIAREQARRVSEVAAVLVAAPHDDLPGAVRLIVRAAMRGDREDGLLASALDHEEARLPVDAIVADALDMIAEPLLTMLTAYADQLPFIDPARAVQTLPYLVRGIVDAWTTARSNSRLDAASALTLAEEEAVRAVLGYLAWRGDV